MLARVTVPAKAKKRSIFLSRLTTVFPLNQDRFIVGVCVSHRLDALLGFICITGAIFNINNFQ
jgi:hypothetical protein